MEYGVCNLSIVPVRAEASDSSEMVTQLLYGEHFKVLEKRKKWSYIRLSFDGYEGWVDNKQFLEINKEIYSELEETQLRLSADMVDFVTTKEEQLISICLGSNISAGSVLEHSFEGKSVQGKLTKKHLISSAISYLNTPYLWGGKSPFGIDCSGFTQMVYKLNGYKLLRDAKQQ